MPITFVLMTNKSLLSYEKIFADILFLSNNYKIGIDFKKYEYYVTLKNLC